MDAGEGAATAARPVRAMWRTPQVAPLFLASLLTRLPFAVVTVLLLLRLREMGASYATGGAVLACYAAGTALSEPLIARWVDRAGQTVVLRTTIPICALAFAGAALAPDACPPALYAVFAAGIGVGYPQVGGMLRALLVGLLADDDQRHAAFALESGVVELLFIGGPVVLVAGIANHAGAAAALAVAGAAMVAGAVWFAFLPASRAWRPHPDHAAGGPREPFLTPRFRLLLVVLLSLGTGFAGLEVAATAFAEAHGTRSEVGLLLALNAAGSLAGGLLAMRAGAPAEPLRRLALLLGAQAALFALLAVPRSMEVMAGAMLFAGATMAPSMALGYGITADVVPASRLTEGYGWMGTALMGGASLGGVLGGAIASAASPSAVFVVIAVPVALAAAATARAARAAPA